MNGERKYLALFNLANYQICEQCDETYEESNQCLNDESNISENQFEFLPGRSTKTSYLSIKTAQGKVQRKEEKSTCPHIIWRRLTIKYICT